MKTEIKKLKTTGNKKTVNQDTTKTFMEMPVVNLKAAGIDVGSRSFFVCVGQGKNDVREFGVFTCDLHEIAHYLKNLGILTVAMESTGFYWKQIFVLLQDYGMEVILVNARHIKNVKGRKTDVVDSRWIQLLHSLGLLSASFQPDLMTEELRTYSRQRQYLIQHASQQVLKMNKNLTLMNLQLKPILRDLVGLSGRSLIQAILNGERDPFRLAELVHPNCKHPAEDFVKALDGNYREEYLFELSQSYDSYKHFQNQIEKCDEKINLLLQYCVEIKENYPVPKYSLAERQIFKYKPPKNINYKNCPPTQIAEQVYNLCGIELLNIPGVNTGTILTLLSEVGLDLSKFKTAKHFASWLGLSPNNKITGGKVISSHTDSKKNRIALAFRDAANSLERIKVDNQLKGFFKRLSSKKGRLIAITATARKIAIIVWNMLTKKVEYNPFASAKNEEFFRKRKMKSIQRVINEYGIKQNELAFAL
ncbi:MAG: IS110 family transposase [bacterium]